MKSSSKENWKSYGQNDPYFGVLSDEKFRKGNLQEDSLMEFFQSGEEFIEATESRLASVFGESLEEKRILDFGCGVGRLTIPFARKTNKQVIGLDVSEGMINEAEVNRSRLALEKLSFVHFHGSQMPAFEKFDFINSYIVFQHIEPKIGYSLLEQLCEKVKLGGIVQFQLTYGHSLPTLKYWNFFMRTNSSLYNFFYTFLKRRRLKAEPVMQMNHYRPEKLIKLFSEYTNRIHLEPTNHGGHLGAIYFFKIDK